MTHADDLEKIAEGGPATWTTCSAAQLSKALERSGLNGARHLSEFCVRVNAWLHRRNGDDENAALLYRERVNWVEKVANQFVGTLNPAKIEALVQQLPRPDGRLDFLTVLFDCGVHAPLVPAALKLCQLLAQSTNGVRPSDAEAKRITNAIQRILYWCARSMNMKTAEAIAQVFQPLPPWLLMEFFCSIGDLQEFVVYELDMALALPLLDVGTIVPPFIDAWRQSKGNHRLARLLWLLGFCIHKPPRHGQVRHRQWTSPTTQQMQQFVIALEQQLHAANAEDSTFVRQWIESAKQQRNEEVNIFASYLNSNPRLHYHEYTFDCLSVYQEPMIPALLRWGLPGVTSSTRSSMISGSVNVESSAKPHFNPPDFEPSLVYGRIKQDAAIALVLEQWSPEFALTYLQKLKSAKHAHYDEIIDQLFANQAFMLKLSSARNEMAAVVLQEVGRLFQFEKDAKRIIVLVNVYTAVLPHVPAKYLENDYAIGFIDRLGQSDLYLDEIMRRLRIAESTEELKYLFRSRYRHKECVQSILDQLDVVRFLVPEDCSDEKLDDWATDLVHLHTRVPEFARRILATCPIALVERVATTWKYFGIVEHDGVGWIAVRVSFKAAVYQRWVSVTSELVGNKLNVLFDRDFWLWHCLGIHGPTGDGTVKEIPGCQWLDVVAIAAPELVEAYLGELLRHAKITMNDLAAPMIIQALEFTTQWLDQHQQEAAPRLWDTLENRLANAPAASVDTVEHGHDWRDGEIVTIGCAKLPGSRQRLRQLRERAVDALLQKYSDYSPPVSHWRLERFAELLRQEEPDLHARVLKHPHAEAQDVTPKPVEAGS